MKKVFYLIFLVTITFSGCMQENIHNEPLIIEPLESMPKFPGGADSLFAYLEKNNQWQVGQLTIEGKVFVGFTVDENGEVEAIEVKKELCPSCDKEAIRLVENMPKWIPAVENESQYPKGWCYQLVLMDYKKITMPNTMHKKPLLSLRAPHARGRWHK